MVFENIFYIEKGYITVYRFQKNKKKFEYVKRDGSKSYPATADFWEWWKRASDYVENNDQTDFCFIYDIDSSIVSSGGFSAFSVSAEESCWKEGAIRSFFEEMVPYAHVELRFPDDSRMKLDKQGQIFGGEYNVLKVFYTNVKLLGKREENDSKKNEKSPFALYFQELRRREREL